MKKIIIDYLIQIVQDQNFIQILFLENKKYVETRTPIFASAYFVHTSPRRNIF